MFACRPPSAWQILPRWWMRRHSFLFQAVRSLLWTSSGSSLIIFGSAIRCQPNPHHAITKLIRCQKIACSLSKPPLDDSADCKLDFSNRFSVLWWQLVTRSVTIARFLMSSAGDRHTSRPIDWSVHWLRSGWIIRSKQENLCSISGCWSLKTNGGGDATLPYSLIERSWE